MASQSVPDLEPSKESTRPIRALLRGLEALQSLNEQNGVTVTEVANLTKLPRTTAYRILETLRVGGYAVRDPVDERYRPTIRVRRLAEGFEDESWIREIARPLIEDLCREIIWPISISTLSGGSMLVRETTDKASPLALERYSAGFRVPILVTGGGQVYLAFCSDEQRETILKILSQSPDPDDALVKETGLVERIIHETRKNGYAKSMRPLHGENSMAVPIFAGKTLLGCLTMRYMVTAMTPQEAVEKYVGRLQQTAGAIGKAYSKAKQADQS